MPVGLYPRGWQNSGVSLEHMRQSTGKSCPGAQDDALTMGMPLLQSGPTPEVMVSGASASSGNWTRQPQQTVSGK